MHTSVTDNTLVLVLVRSTNSVSKITFNCQLVFVHCQSYMSVIQNINEQVHSVSLNTLFVTNI